MLLSSARGTATIGWHFMSWNMLSSCRAAHVVISACCQVTSALWDWYSSILVPGLLCCIFAPCLLGTWQPVSFLCGSPSCSAGPPEYMLHGQCLLPWQQADCIRITAGSNMLLCDTSCLWSYQAKMRHFLCQDCVVPWAPWAVQGGEALPGFLEGSLPVLPGAACCQAALFRCLNCWSLVSECC